jgi:hypothetical protein
VESIYTATTRRSHGVLWAIHASALTAQGEFFGKEKSETRSLNDFALRWGTPEPFYDPTFYGRTPESY